MHDPNTLAFDIYLGRKLKKNGHYRSPIISIWHLDPEKDGSDDSCGWFIRSRHIDPAIIEKVRKEFEFNFKHDYWFNSGGYPKFSTIGTVINMYSSAAWQIFMYLDNNKPTDSARNKWRRFMKKHLWDIMYFAENPTDSLYDSIHMKYGVEMATQRIEYFTNVITADIFRKLRPWYKHPRWHIHHWRITVPALRSLYRRYIQRCDICHKRFGTSSVFTDWDGTKHWCSTCNRTTEKPSGSGTTFE